MSAARLSDAQGEATRPRLPARPRMGRPLAVLDALFVMRAGGGGPAG